MWPSSHLLKNFPKFVVIHTVKGFGVVHKPEVDVFLELSCFLNDPTVVSVGNKCISHGIAPAVKQLMMTF